MELGQFLFTRITLDILITIHPVAKVNQAHAYYFSQKERQVEVYVV